MNPTPNPDGRRLSGKKVFIHPMSYGAARVMAAGFRALGLDAEITPPSDHLTLELGSRHTGGDECYPAKITVGDYMKVLQRPDVDPARTILVMPAADGPCRFGQYSVYLRQILDANGFTQTEVMSPTCADGYEMDAAMQRTIWRGVVASDIVLKLLLQHRPYEQNPGDSDRVYEECLDDLCRTVASTPTAPAAQIRAFRGVLERCRARFRGLAVRRDRSTPLVGIVGEIFCRLNAFSNDDLIRRLEGYGAEAWISDIAEWVWYSNTEQFRNLRLAGRLCSLEALGAWIRNHVQHRDEHFLIESFREDFAGYEEPNIKEILEAARPYLPQDGAMGEMVLNVGKAVCLARRGVDGIVDISPFTCMNGVVCEAIYPRLSRDLGGIPIRNFYFDGTQSDLDSDLGVFLELARTYQRRKKSARPWPP
ncbi:MAG: hypothetical protein AAB225_20595, partial [Acidobacteriota bacterium]